MKVLCVDSEERAVNDALALLRAQRAVDVAAGFTRAADARVWFKMNGADIVLLDVGLPDMDGIELAKELRKLQPSLAVIFLTKDKKNAFRAYSAHPQNYLLKPLDGETLAREINYFLMMRARQDMSHIEAQTFGNFVLTVDGSAVRFKRAKAKELLALLVDRRGSPVSRREAFLEMWEDREYDLKAQNYFNVILDSMCKTLRAYGVSEMVEINYGLMRVRPETFDCDLYRYLRGDSDAINAFRGDYLYGYPWAEWSWGY